MASPSRNSFKLAIFFIPTIFQPTLTLVAGWSPANPQTNAWVALEASYGNGFLDRLEHRQQYKLNGLREDLRGGLAVRYPYFNLAQQRYDLFRFVPLVWHIQPSSS
jgi:hypothetical protein